MSKCHLQGGSKMNEIQELINMADAGDVKAQEKVGVSYLKGSGVDKDINKALEYFKVCAEQGSGLGNYQLGKAYETGNGVAPDMLLAISYYKKSAELGYANAKNVLSQIENSDREAATISNNQMGGYVAPSVPQSSVPQYGEKIRSTGKEKSKTVAIILALFLGVLGVHNFYMGYTKKAIIQLILTITVIGMYVSGIWAFIELIMLITGKICCDGKGCALR